MTHLQTDRRTQPFIVKDVSCYRLIVVVYLYLAIRKLKRMKHVHNTSQSRSLNNEDSYGGSDISLTCSSLSEDSVTILDERPGANMDHGRLARHVWDRYTSTSDIGLEKSKSEREPTEDDKMTPVMDPVVSRKEERDLTVDSANPVVGNKFALSFDKLNTTTICLGMQGESRSPASLRCSPVVQCNSICLFYAFQFSEITS